MEAAMKDKNRFYRRPYKVIAVVLHVLCIAVLIGGVIALAASHSSR